MAFHFTKQDDLPVIIPPLKKTYKWDGGSGPLTTCLELFSEEAANKTELAYIITVGGKVKYVGEFSGTLRSRWLKIDSYIWHHKDSLIDKSLSDGHEVLLWLLNDPVIEITSSVELNISKAVEHHLLKHEYMEWNQRNAMVKKS